MGRILKRLLLGLLVLIGIFAAVVAMQPTDFVITRSAKMSAPPAKVFEQVNDFQKWSAWSPWAKLDPNAKNTFEGPSTGTGSKFKWSGNDEVGEGMMTITESKPNELIKMKLDFIRPFEDTSDTEFAFKPEGEQTKMTWTMTGKHNFISKAFCLFMDMDVMVGGQFEEGLASIKKIVETPAAK